MKLLFFRILVLISPDALLQPLQSLSDQFPSAGQIHAQKPVAVSVEGKSLDLTRTEFNLLRLLLTHPGRVYTRAQIIDLTQDEDKAVTDRTVDTQMVGLRRKLGAWAAHIETIRGVGYRMNP